MPQDQEMHRAARRLRLTRLGGIETMNACLHGAVAVDGKNFERPGIKLAPQTLRPVEVEFEQLEALLVVRQPGLRPELKVVLKIALPPFEVPLVESVKECRVPRPNLGLQFRGCFRFGGPEFDMHFALVQALRRVVIDRSQKEVPLAMQSE